MLGGKHHQRSKLYRGQELSRREIYHLFYHAQFDCQVSHVTIANVEIVGHQRIEFGEITNDLVQVPYGSGGIRVNGVDRVQFDVIGRSREKSVARQ